MHDQKVARGDWSVSLENPEPLFAVPGSAPLLRADRDRLPDLTARLRWKLGAGTYTAQLLARDIRIDSGAPLSTTDSRWGGTVGVSGVVPVFGRSSDRWNIAAAITVLAIKARRRRMPADQGDVLNDSIRLESETS